MKRILIYIGCFLVAAGFFLYTLFPAPVIERYIVAQVESYGPELTATIGGLRPDFPPGIRLADLTLFHLSSPLLQADQARISLTTRMLFEPQPRLRFRGQAYGGSFKGIYAGAGGEQGGSYTLTADLAGIQIGDLPIAAKIPDYGISGLLGGKVDFSSKGLTRKGNFALVIADAAVALKTPFFDIERVSFNRIESDFNLNNRTVVLRRCNMAGPQIGGDFNGSVIVLNPIGRSILRIRGTLRPQAAFMAELQEKVPAGLLPNDDGQLRAIPVRIAGTFDRPRVSLR